MKKQIVISDLYNIAAITFNNIIQEFLFSTKKHQINNIYIGIVQRVFPSINAAFIDIDKNSRSGFIHFSDLTGLKRTYNATNFSNQLITNILFNEQKIVVQIVKESTIKKGPRLTTNITIVGRYIVLMPFGKSICVSRKIQNTHQRYYLKSLGILIKPATMGILFRFSAIGISEDIIISELQSLKKQWNFIQKLACNCSSPKLLYNDKNLIKRVIRDLYDINTSNIILDSRKSCNSTKKYLLIWKCYSQNSNLSVQLFERKESILKFYGIRNSLIDALSKKVELPLGGYIFIETLEALTVIDVNSGAFNQSINSKDTVYKINITAAKEIAYQLRIRNIAGLIIVDFIDMHSQRDQLNLLEYFYNCLDLDNARSQIVQLSELGLVELTRKRRGKSLYELSQFFFSYSVKSYKYEINSGNEQYSYNFISYFDDQLKLLPVMYSLYKQQINISLHYSNVGHENNQTINSINRNCFKLLKCKFSCLAFFSQSRYC
uniref:Ribonuclease E n=1 Tax=Boldia erythrosiphon TaxID=74908 RepID=A0A1X9PVC8_9RHOD|nr:ribonuclease E [Boldia erythrosiphon]ARO90663.1 ribonuclease E [Boldia erythrosiphon]